MVKRYRSVFSFKFLRRVFGMSSRERSPNNLHKGLWSTAMTRSEQPSTKWRALSRASATARASPSMGAYRDSAACVNREPTNVTFQPSWQQKISRDGHWQCFWNSQYPTPSLLQSVAKHVGRFLSKIRTPSWIREVISTFEASKACWSSGVQVNVEDGFSRDRNGAMTEAIEKAKATWLTNPNQALMSVMPVGVGKSEIARRYFLHGRTSVLVISNPANSTSSLAKQNLSGFRVMPFLAQISSHSVAWWKASSIEPDQRSASSMHFVFLVTSAIRLSYLAV